MMIMKVVERGIYSFNPSLKPDGSLCSSAYNVGSCAALFCNLISS
jgi:hypothetical protein